MGEEGNSTTISSNGVDPTKPTEPYRRELIRMEFYKTYDVMTGVRIALTLGGFFSLMVLLVVYKSKCKSRSISEENLEATVTAAVEEEAIGFSIRKGYSLYSGAKHYGVGIHRNSAYAPPRFSSVGGGYNIYAPPVRYGFPLQGRVSLPTSSPYIYPSPYSPRNATDSPPPKHFKEVIQPTPNVSPAESQISVFKCQEKREPATLCVPRIAPLASISSCRIPSLEHDSHSIGSDSVFLDEELIDTEDEVEEFSTDSDAENLECNIPSKIPRNDPKFNALCSVQLVEHSTSNRVTSRRFSSPMPNRVVLSQFTLPGSKEERKPSSSNSSFISTLKSTLRTSSDSETLHISRGVEKKPNRSFTSISRTSMSASCDQLVKVLQEHTSQSDITTKIVEHCSWSQETLF
uniref:Uncharacterized protein n=2 Tax=Lygus hesperus TaxID=30085 RepID=A0A146LQJ0_LYGHE